MKRRSIVKLLISVTLLFGLTLFLIKSIKPAKIVLMHKKAINNYKKQETKLKSFPRFANRFINEDLQLIGTDSIYLSFSNWDKNERDSIYHNNQNKYFSATDTWMNMNFQEMKRMSCEISGNNFMICGRDTFERWNVNYVGADLSEELDDFFDHLSLDVDLLGNQIAILNNSEFDRIITHREGFDLNYHGGFEHQVGCIVAMRNPIWINFGSSYNRRKRSGKSKSLDENVTSYFDFEISSK